MHGRINDVFRFQECRLRNELQLPPQLKRRQEKKTEKEMEELKRIMERAILSRKGFAMGKITQKKIIIIKKKTASEENSEPSADWKRERGSSRSGSLAGRIFFFTLFSSPQSQSHRLPPAMLLVLQVVSSEPFHRKRQASCHLVTFII